VLNILHVTPEIAPHSRSGALADTTAALANAQRLLGHGVSVLSPLYRGVPERSGPLSRPVSPLTVQLGRSRTTANIYIGTGRHGVRHFFVDAPGLYDRPGLYGDEAGEYPDNAYRFAVLAKAAIALNEQYDMGFDVVHCHDWQAALAPLYRHAAKDPDKKLARLAMVLTVHDLVSQGRAPLEEAPRLGLTKAYLKPGDDGVVLDGQLSLLKAGLLYADAVSTVSPTYAREICTPEYGAGLDAVLRARQNALVGILDGVDYGVWSPEADSLLPFAYTSENQNGKRRCKAELQARFGLPLRPRLPLVGVVSELTLPKGIDLLLEGIRPLLVEHAAQLVIVGDGDTALREGCRALAEAFPEAVGLKLGEQDDALAHLVYGGADIYAMPSRFESCGHSQLQAMRYGAIPVGRDTGGLHDTIIDYEPGGDAGTGFLFQEPSPAALEGALRRAVETYHQGRRWRQLIAHAMQTDFSWKRAAHRYLDLYETVLERIREPERKR
jgi:starch synthase